MCLRPPHPDPPPQRGEGTSAGHALGLNSMALRCEVVTLFDEGDPWKTLRALEVGG